MTRFATGRVSSYRETSSSPPSRVRHASITRSCEPTSTPTSTKTLRLATEWNRDRGLIDTSVAVDLATLDRRTLPAAIAVSALTIAELVSGPPGAGHDLKRVRRKQHLRYVEAMVEPLDFDPRCAYAYGSVYREVARIGRKPRGSRVLDLLIAATALAHALPLYTKNAKDLHGLENVIEIVDVGRPSGS